MLSTCAAPESHSLIEAIFSGRQGDPSGLAFVFLSEDAPPQEISNRRFEDDARKYARALRGQGIVPGNVVFLALDHGYDLLACFWGTVLCGAIPSVLTYWRSGTDQDVYCRKVEGLARSVGLRAVVSLPALASSMQSALKRLHCLILTPPDLYADSSPTTEDLPAIDSDQIALMQFTSGTTGDPKAVRFSHRAIFENVRASSLANNLKPDCVTVSWLPFYHDMGLICHIRALIFGKMLVSMSPQSWLRKPEMLLHAISRYRGTITNMPNFGFEYCAQRIREDELAGIDLSCWEVLSNGSEPVLHTSMERFAKRFAPFGFRRNALSVAYGMAENVVGVSVTPPGRDLLVDWVSADGLHLQKRAVPVQPGEAGALAVTGCGHPYPGVEIAIVDDDWRTLGDREVGEIIIRSKSLIKEYYPDPRMENDRFSEGWFRTGDIGYMIAGELFVCDRKKDLIISGGRNIHPRTIENIAQSVFGGRALRCAAFGMTAKHMGTQLPVLIIELASTPDQDDLLQLLYQTKRRISEELDVTLADAKTVAKGWLIKTTSGKIAREASLRKYLTETKQTDLQSAAPVQDSFTPEQIRRDLIALFEDILGTSPVGPQDDFILLGGDSLSVLRLITEIEQRYGREISTSVFFQQPTAEHLANLLLYQKDSGEDSSSRPAKQFFRPKQKPLPSLLRQKKGNFIYGAFARWRWLCGHKWLQPVLSFKTWRLVRHFHHQIVAPRADASEAVRCVLLCDIPKTFHKHLFKPVFEHWPGSWTLQTETATLSRAYQQGKGLILVGRHTAFWSGPLTKDIIMQCLNPKEYSLIGYVKRFLPEKESFLPTQDNNRLRLAVFSQQLLEARKTLKRSGIVNILPDAQGGASSGLTFPFHGRMHSFKTGFAELALQTGAPVIAVSLVVDIGGKVVSISFSDPFDAGPESMPQAERVERLVGQYVAFLHNEWANGPGTVTLKRMKKHIRKEDVRSMPSVRGN